MHAPVTPAPPDTLRQLRALSASASCRSDAQCHTVAVGARPCGGADFYLPWSSTQASSAQVAVLAGRYRAERIAANAAAGALSTCMLQRDPGALCRPAPDPQADGRCVLRQAAPAGGDPR